MLEVVFLRICLRTVTLNIPHYILCPKVVMRLSLEYMRVHSLLRANVSVSSGAVRNQKGQMA